MVCRHIFRYTPLNIQTVLFLTIQFSISQQSQMVPSIAMKHNSIKQYFVYAQLNDQTVLFLTIQLRLSHFLAHNLNVKQ